MAPIIPVRSRALVWGQNAEQSGSQKVRKVGFGNAQYAFDEHVFRLYEVMHLFLERVF